MKPSLDSINRRLEFLYRKIDSIHDDFPIQRDYILTEIDKNMAMLLEIEVEQEYQEIEENNLKEE